MLPITSRRKDFATGFVEPSALREFPFPELCVGSTPHRFHLDHESDSGAPDPPERLRRSAVPPRPRRMFGHIERILKRLRCITLDIYSPHTVRPQCCPDVDI